MIVNIVRIVYRASDIQIYIPIYSSFLKLGEQIAQLIHFIGVKLNLSRIGICFQQAALGIHIIKFVNTHYVKAHLSNSVRNLFRVLMLEENVFVRKVCTPELYFFIGF